MYMQKRPYIIESALDVNFVCNALQDGHYMTNHVGCNIPANNLSIGY